MTHHEIATYSRLIISGTRSCGETEKRPFRAEKNLNLQTWYAGQLDVFVVIVDDMPDKTQHMKFMLDIVAVNIFFSIYQHILAIIYYGYVGQV